MVRVSSKCRSEGSLGDQSCSVQVLHLYIGAFTLALRSSPEDMNIYAVSKIWTIKGGNSINYVAVDLLLTDRDFSVDIVSGTEHL